MKKLNVTNTGNEEKCPDCIEESGICQVCWSMEKEPDSFVLQDNMTNKDETNNKYDTSVLTSHSLLHIELRAYSPEHDEMYYMGDDRHYRFEIYEGSIWYIPRNEDENFTFCTRNDCEYIETKLIIVTQFIGLFAKENKKIFEGDRLKCKRGYFYTVIFRSGEFRIKREDKDTEYRKGDSRSLTHIGNIFENHN